MFTKLLFMALLGPISTVQALNLEPAIDKISSFLNKDTSKTGMFIGACALMCYRLYRIEKHRKEETSAVLAKIEGMQYDIQAGHHVDDSCKLDVFTKAYDLGVTSEVAAFLKHDLESGGRKSSIHKHPKSVLPANFSKKMAFKDLTFFKF